jgi:hypothetical protein
MGLKYQILIDALREYDNQYGRGGKAHLSEISGIDPNIIGRIIHGKTTKPSIETWDALCDALPEHIPPPQFDRIYKGNPINAEQQSCPLFGINGSCEGMFKKDHCILTESRFFAYAQDDALAPDICVGDIVVVDPVLPPKNKRICYIHDVAGHPEAAGCVRRYNLFGKTVVLSANDSERFPDIILKVNKKTKNQMKIFGVLFRVCKEK